MKGSVIVESYCEGDVGQAREEAVDNCERGDVRQARQELAVSEQVT